MVGLSDPYKIEEIEEGEMKHSYIEKILDSRFVDLDKLEMRVQFCKENKYELEKENFVVGELNKENQPFGIWQTKLGKSKRDCGQILTKMKRRKSIFQLKEHNGEDLDSGIKLSSEKG